LVGGKAEQDGNCDGDAVVDQTFRIVPRFSKEAEVIECPGKFSLELSCSFGERTCNWTIKGVVLGLEKSPGERGIAVLPRKIYLVVQRLLHPQS
jgi:hypothetical protein